MILNPVYHFLNSLSAYAVPEAVLNVNVLNLISLSIGGQSLANLNLAGLNIALGKRGGGQKGLLKNLFGRRRKLLTVRVNPCTNAGSSSSMNFHVPDT